MAKPVKLSNGRSWATQTAAKAHFKAMLNKYADGQRVEDEGDHSDLGSLVEAYDRDVLMQNRKSGQGIDHFYRNRDQEHGGLTSCFYICRIDESTTDFSYLRAVEVASKA
jgi:hypothetical protein